MTIQVQQNKYSIYHYDRDIASLHKQIKALTSARNAELILKYDREMVQNSLAKATRRKHLEVLNTQSRVITKDWDKLTNEDIKELVFWIVQKYSPDTGQETNSTWDHKKVLKIFFRWVKLGSREHRLVGDPEETKFIRLKPVKNKIVREDLITKEDCEKMLRSCNGNLRDKALIHVQYEAGTRPGEILSLKIKHVKFDNIGAVIHVDGKTGPRPVRLVTSVPSLAAWRDAHPFRDDPEAPMFMKIDQNHYGQPLTWATANKILKTVAARAKLNKKINLKLFRHSEATETAKYMTESQMRIRHGWTQTSRIPANYVHLVGADVEKAYLSHLGIIEEEKQDLDMPKLCHICKMPNSRDSEICNKCGKPLDLKKAMELEEKAKDQNFMANKLAAKFLVQMLMTGQIPKLPKSEINSLIQGLNL